MTDMARIDAALAELREAIREALEEPHEEPALVSIEVAARQLGISKRSAHNRLNDGTLRAVRVGPRRRLVPTAEIRRLAADGIGRPR